MTKLAWNARTAATFLFEHNKSIEYVTKALEEIRQPVKGYYYTDEVRQYLFNNKG